MIPAYPRALVRSAEAEIVARAAASGDADLAMRSAAAALAAEALDMLEGAAGEAAAPGPLVCALAGGGDNGGDALYAAALLASRGVPTVALALGTRIHERAAAAAREAGVEILDARTLLDSGAPLGSDPELRAALAAPLWIDGILGTGIDGAPREPLSSALRELDSLRGTRGARVLAADVPSGALSDEGEILGPLLRAERTVTMGAMKTPLILPPASFAAGRVRVHELGLDLPESPIRLVTDADLLDALAVPGETDHKYTRGVAGLVAGSDTYPGAGLLAVLGAQAAGPGMIRLDAPRRVEDLVLARAPGVVTSGGRIQAGLVGPGMDADTEQACRELARFCASSGLPLIIDAGALGLVPELVSAGIGEASLLTPHAGEAAALLRALGEPVPRWWVEERPATAARRIAELSGAHVLLKGAACVLAAPDGALLAIPAGLGWTGVAGAGDVLAGLLTGLAATWRAAREAHRTPLPFAELIGAGALIHARAGALAARAFGPAGAPISAQDIAAAVPRLLGAVLSGENAEGGAVEYWNA